MQIFCTQLCGFKYSDVILIIFILSIRLIGENLIGNTAPSQSGPRTKQWFHLP